MSPIEQPCPGCGRKLQLPAEAVGRTAKCPACEVQFKVTLPGSGGFGDGENPAAATPNGLGSPPPASQPSVDPYAETSAGGPPPFSSSPYGAGPGQGGAAQTGANPYQPTSDVGAPYATVNIGPFQVRQLEFEAITSTTWAIFKERWVNLLLSTLAVIAIIVVVVLGGMLLFGGLAAIGGNDLAGVLVALGAIVIVPLMIFISMAVTVGWAQTIIGIAQNHPSPLSLMLPSLGLIWKGFLSSVLIMLMVIAAFVLFGLFFGLFAAAAGPDIAVLFGGVFGFIVQFGLQFVIQFFMWPWVYMICHEHTTALGSITNGFRLAMHNKLTSVLLVVCAVVLSIIGMLMCYVGMIITQPLSMLLMCVAYLMLTNQHVDDPRARQTYPASPPPLPQ